MLDEQKQPVFRISIVAKTLDWLAPPPFRMAAAVSRFLIQINMASENAVRQTGCMGHILFKCPRTGLNVQHWLAEEVEPDNPQSSYETVVCKACTRLHFINRATGKLMGDK